MNMPILTLGLMLACTLLPMPARGAEPAVLADRWTPISDQRLAQMRGGFVLASGVLVHFGVERSVFVNGELVASRQWQLDGTGLWTSASGLAEPGAWTDAVAPLWVRNAADGQSLRTFTTIDVNVATLAMFKLANAQMALQNGIANTAVSR